MYQWINPREWAQSSADLIALTSWAALIALSAAVVVSKNASVPDWLPDQVANRPDVLAGQLLPVQLATGAVILPSLAFILHLPSDVSAHVRFRLVGPWPIRSLLAGAIVLPLAAVALSAGHGAVQHRLSLLFVLGGIAIVVASAGAVYARHDLVTWIARTERLVDKATRPRRADAALEALDSLLSVVSPASDRYDSLVELLARLEAPRLDAGNRHARLEIATRHLRLSAVNQKALTVLAACSVGLGGKLIGSLERDAERERGTTRDLDKFWWRRRDLQGRKDDVKRKVTDAIFGACQRLRERDPRACLGALVELLDGVGERRDPPDPARVGRVDNHAPTMSLRLGVGGNDQRIVDQAALAMSETIERAGATAIIDPLLHETLASLAAAAVRTGYARGDAPGIRDPARTWASALRAGVEQGGHRAQDELRNAWRWSLRRMMEEHRDRETAKLIELVLTGLIDGDAAGALSSLTVKPGRPDGASLTEEHRLAWVRAELVSSTRRGEWMQRLSARGGASDQHSPRSATDIEGAETLEPWLDLVLPLYDRTNLMTARALSRLGESIARSAPSASPELVSAWIQLGHRLTKLAQPDAPASVRLAASYATLCLAGGIVRAVPTANGPHRWEAGSAIGRWSGNASELARDGLVDGTLQAQIAARLDGWEEAVTGTPPHGMSDEEKSTWRNPGLSLQADEAPVEHDVRAWLQSQRGLAIWLWRSSGTRRVVAAFAEPPYRSGGTAFLPGANLDVENVEWHHTGCYVADRVAPWLLEELLGRDDAARSRATSTGAEASLADLAGVPASDSQGDRKGALSTLLRSTIEDCASLPREMDGAFDLADLVGLRAGEKHEIEVKLEDGSTVDYRLDKGFKGLRRVCDQGQQDRRSR